MPKPLTFLALVLTVSMPAASALAAPSAPSSAAPSAPAPAPALDPVQSLLDLDRQLSAARTDNKKKPALEDFREELPVSVSGQKSAELEKLPLGPDQD